MARRRAKLDLTLFPFLSVLAGLIAVLMLFMIVTISTRVVDEAAAAPPPPPPPDERPGGRGPKSDAEPDDAAIDKESYEELQREIDRLTAQLNQRLEMRRELAKRYEDLIELIEAKKTELVAAPKPGDKQVGVKIGEPTPVNVIPEQNVNVKKQPIYVEVSSDGYFVHPDGKKFPPAERNPEEFDPDVKISTELRTYLNEMQKSASSKYLVFLIHPNGADAFNALRAVMDKTYTTIETGWEPFAREWILSGKMKEP